MEKELLEMAAKVGVAGERAAALYQSGVTVDLVNRCRDRFKIDLPEISTLYAKFGSQSVLWLIELLALCKG